MQVQKGFQCSACNTFLSHPIDSCPVCSDQFYWMVVTVSPISDAQRGAFVAAMVNLVEGGVTEEFLTHGDQLWLPYRFWVKDASGTSLAEFGWIQDLELFQHNLNRAPAAEVETPQSEPKPWETIPKMALPDFSAGAPVIRPGKSAAPIMQAPIRNPAPTGPEPAPKSKLSKKKAKKKEKAVLDEGRRLIPKQLFIPAMIFLFFLLLSLSYLTLRYHKNHMAPKAPSQSLLEESHEWLVLS